MRSISKTFFVFLCLSAAVPVESRADQVRCESHGPQRIECPLDNRGDVYLLENLSKTGCREGYNWGTSRYGVWVSGGCCAIFASDERGGGQRYVPESCPPGFSPSERKCSPEERRRGCKDIRLNSGLGCVSR